MKKIKISFSREVAETLGLESAVILELFNQNLLDNSSYDDLVLSINENANYLDDGKIESSIDKLLRYDFIKIKNTSTGANFSVKQHQKIIIQKELVMIGCRLMKHLKLLIWQKYQANF